MTKRIAHFGTFDVLNYGDLLFPTVARHFLGQDAEFTWISPRGGAPVCPDAVATQGALDVRWDELVFDVALIGGGNIVTTERTTLPDYAEPRGLALAAYPSLWLAASLRASEIGAAIAWNAPGVMQPAWSHSARAALECCFRMSDYVSLREDAHVAWLEGETRDAVNLVPDTAVAMPKIWTPSSLDADLKSASEKLGLTKTYFVVHLKPRNLRQNELRRSVAREIDRLAIATGLTPVLTPIGRCHGDDDILRLVALDMAATAIVASKVIGLRETTALIANAAYVFAASLHCAIIAAAYGAPVRLLQTGDMPKYRGFFEHRLGVPDVMAATIHEALSPESVAAAVDRRPSVKIAVDRAIGAVEKHFADIEDAVARPVDRVERGKAALKSMHEAQRATSSIGPYLPFGAFVA